MRNQSLQIKPWIFYLRWWWGSKFQINLTYLLSAQCIRGFDWYRKTQTFLLRSHSQVVEMNVKISNSDESQTVLGVITGNCGLERLLIFRYIVPQFLYFHIRFTYPNSSFLPFCFTLVSSFFSAVQYYDSYLFKSFPNYLSIFQYFYWVCINLIPLYRFVLNLCSSVSPYHNCISHKSSRWTSKELKLWHIIWH